VLATVEFDHEFRSAAREIDDERTDGNLPAEVRTDQHDVVAEPLPKHALGRSRLGPHPARKLLLAIVHRK